MKLYYYLYFLFIYISLSFLSISFFSKYFYFSFSLSIKGLYFDDPVKVDSPRWAAGFAIQADSFEQIQKIVSGVQEKSGLSEVIKAVRIGNGSNILKASIPYHNSITPMVAPMIQWKRAYNAYDKGGYKSFNGRPKDDCPAPALEVYYTGTNFTSMTGMDYIVLMGDTTETYDDCYPRDEKEATSES